ncbi:hypothetical protein Hanom_Chr04g00313881 [Helianthus anomalus]
MLKLAIAYLAIFNLVFISFIDCTRIQSSQRHEASVLNSSSKLGSFACKENGSSVEWCCLCDIGYHICTYHSYDECQTACSIICKQTMRV